MRDLTFLLPLTIVLVLGGAIALIRRAQRRRAAHAIAMQVLHEADRRVRYQDTFPRELAPEQLAHLTGEPVSAFAAPTPTPTPAPAPTSARDATVVGHIGGGARSVARATERDESWRADAAADVFPPLSYPWPEQLTQVRDLGEEIARTAREMLARYPFADGAWSFPDDAQHLTFVDELQRLHTAATLIHRHLEHAAAGAS